MLKIVYYSNENKMLSGYDSCCAYIDTDNFNGYTSLESIEPRCSTYKEAKEELLRNVIKLRDELNDLIKRETVENDCCVEAKNDWQRMFRM